MTYGELLGHVSKLAGFLRSQGVKKGDIVTIYMSMVPEVIYSLLACARIGAVHSVVFAGFSAAALRDRIVDANSKIVITADEGRRGGKSIPTKHIVDEALKDCPCVSTVLIYERTGSQVPWVTGRDFWWNEELQNSLRISRQNLWTRKTTSSCFIRPVQLANLKVSFIARQDIY